MSVSQIGDYPVQRRNEPAKTRMYSTDSNRSSPTTQLVNKHKMTQKHTSSNWPSDPLAFEQTDFNCVAQHGVRCNILSTMRNCCPGDNQRINRSSLYRSSMVRIYDLRSCCSNYRSSVIRIDDNRKEFNVHRLDGIQRPMRRVLKVRIS
mmetsp:Transcript_2306/g.6166  ORF Transcript_2306/g.6166 Transcript_2306/m.6166 type:complete len:149 (-) Transcript_2306:347-793(-)